MAKNLLKLLYGLIGLGILGVLVVVITVTLFSLSLPKISKLSDYQPNIPSKILAKDGTVLAEIGKEKRYVKSIEEIPKRVIDAVVSAEDSGFYEHTGVEYVGLLRALIVNLKEGRYAQGGSTITQQVAKSLLLTNERSISRKVKDMLLAQKMEKRFSKDEILYFYLNQVYLGGGYYGVAAAFDGYFNKELKDATVAEAAMVAGLLVAPGKYSPYINPKRAKIRQGYVLGRMLENKKITKEEYDEALKEQTKFRLRRGNDFLAGHFTDWVRQRVISLVGEKEFLTQGFQVKTTLDYELQQVAEREVKRTVKDIDKRQGFKGPLKQVPEDKISQWIEESRKKFIKEQSNFFTINEKSEKVYEVEFDDTFSEKLADHTKNFKEVIKSKSYSPGRFKDDQAFTYLKEGDNYKGIVLGVSDRARLVYVSVNGVNGVIPYSGFRWAHERVIATERNYFPDIRKPSTILKKGDVILVELKKKSTTFKKAMDKTFAKYYKKLGKNELRVLNQQRYCLFNLDQKPDAEGALISIQPFSSELVSMVGGQSFQKSQFNRAIQSLRQPGSSFKPLLYAAALENGYTPSSIIIDSPETLGGMDEGLNWKPRNYDGKFKGPITFRNSLEQSRNVTTIKIADDLGVKKIIDYMNRIDFKAKLDQDLSLALGSFGVTLMDIVSTYALFPNGGVKIEPKSILSIHNRKGEEISFVEKRDRLEEPNTEDALPEEEQEVVADVQEAEEKEEGEEKESEEEINPYLTSLTGDQVYDRRLAYIMTNLLRGVVLHGTGRGAKSVSTYLGGKTGTTNNYVDAWFIGFSQKLATGVWTGFDDNGTLGWGETGAKAALPVWREFMRASIRKYGESDFKVPLGIVHIPIDKNTGKKVDSGKVGFMESFVEGDIEGRKKAVARKNNEEDIGSEPLLEDDDYYENQ